MTRTTTSHRAARAAPSRRRRCSVVTGLRRANATPPQSVHALSLQNQPQRGKDSGSGQWLHAERQHRQVVAQGASGQVEERLGHPGGGPSTGAVMVGLEQGGQPLLADEEPVEVRASVAPSV